MVEDAQRGPWPKNEANESDIGYCLPRSIPETQRLNAQHHLYVKTLGYTLHPSIVVGLPLNARVADVATGTGIFLIDLANVSPLTWNFSGFDISSKSFPAPSCIPRNVRFHTVDAKRSFPTEFHGQFDCITLRLTAAAMDEGDYAIVAANVMELLKPGGAVQWIEANHIQNFTMLSWDAKAKPSAMQELADMALTIPTVRDRCTYGLAIVDETLRKAGYENVHRIVVSSDRLPELRSLGSQVIIGAYTNALELAKIEEDKVAQLKAQAAIEIENGAYSRFDVHINLARRPC